jgi:hypothetical protein
LESEGFENFDGDRLIEGFARHLMTAIDTWQAEGFAALAKNYLGHLATEGGSYCELDTNGDLLVTRAGMRNLERRELVPALMKTAWLDPVTRMPQIELETRALGAARLPARGFT